MTQIACILRKDLVLEMRSRESVPSMAIFACVTLVVFHFALQRDELEGSLAAGVLWVTLLFAAVLGVNRLFAAEREDGAMDAILAAPIDRTALYFAKSAALFCYLVALEVVALPVFALFYLTEGFGASPVTLLAVLAAANAGLALVGSLVASLAARTRVRDLLTPLLMLPLMVPVVIAASASSAPIFDPAGSGVAVKWLLVLALYDLLFGMLAYALFDFVVED